MARFVMRSTQAAMGVAGWANAAHTPELGDAHAMAGMQRCCMRNNSLVGLDPRCACHC